MTPQHFLTWMLLIQTERAKRAVIEIEDSANVKLTTGQGIVIIDNQGNVKVHRTAEMVPHDLLKMIARDWLMDRPIGIEDQTT